ncbi:SDR family NAD(P)-dependent oxidoreductase [Streptomyces collinus]|uniref:SDR family NAD(P)-dependent oxidoreductase n=1 Tax=Streptomyces collinus TaxID=42684 RepID=UPI0036AD895D
MRFRGKRVFVTGAASGIGATTFELFRREGAQVVGVDLTAADGLVHCDVTDPESVTHAMTETVDRLGGLDVCVNVAGTNALMPFADMPLDQWQNILAVNVTGPMLVTQAALPHLKQSRGNVVSVASVSGLQAQPYFSAYGTSKAGLLMLMKSIAVELAADHVRVNCVCPGGVGKLPTREDAGERLDIPDGIDMSLLGRMRGVLPGVTEQDDIAQAIAYLASDSARSVTGAALVVDRATVW